MEAAKKVDHLEAAVDQIITAGDGDLRDPIRAVVVANRFGASLGWLKAFIETGETFEMRK